MVMRSVILVAALLALSACSEGTTVQEAKEDEGQIGASSGPNPNFDGASAGDAFGEPTPSEQDPGIGANSSDQTAPQTDTPPG
jgi:hypothetical protein